MLPVSLFQLVLRIVLLLLEHAACLLAPQHFLALLQRQLLQLQLLLRQHLLDLALLRVRKSSSLTTQ